MMKFVKLFSNIGINDIDIVGGKNASLGQMIQHLKSKEINVPLGFAITVEAYWNFLEYNNLIDFVKQNLQKITDINDIKTLQIISSKIQKTINSGKYPKELINEISKSYDDLCKLYRKKNIDVAVRSSATAEDLPNASFAGQQESFLNISGIENILNSVKQCIASLFTERAIAYRIEQKFDHFKVAISIGIQKMVRSDKSSSGVLFTLDTETGFKDVIIINSAYGLGQNIVQGCINPDEFHVFKTTLTQGQSYKPIIKKTLGSKEKKLIYYKNNLKNINVTKRDRQLFSLTDEEILELARQAITIEQYYSKLYNKWHPVDIEWAKDGIDNKIYIVQARPETVQANQSKNTINQYLINTNNSEIITTGLSIGKKIATGKVHILKNINQASSFKQGDILVTNMTDPDWVQIMKKAAAIITDQGGRTCHAAIVSRELGIPAIVGTNNATKKVYNKQEVTVDCSQGLQGFIYNNKLDFKIKETKLKEIPKAPIPILLNIANPETAYESSFLPVDGVGLARMEFIITNYIKIHPMAICQPKLVKNKKTLSLIKKISAAYQSPKDFYIETLAQGIAVIAASFYPKSVTLRLSDFKSNEYKNLIGGKDFEPKEENPMIGFRGASRYCDSNFEEAFTLECLAIKKARDEMGLKNLNIMIPFVRTTTEAKSVIKLLNKQSLTQKKDNLKIIMMCEIPSNVILLEEFAKIFDGFSIGSNDLAQLTLGIDRDSSKLAPIFDERDPAVKTIIKMAIEKANKINKPISICGQAPSDYEDFAKFLIKTGINSISLSADSIIPFLMKNYRK